MAAGRAEGEGGDIGGKPPVKESELEDLKSQLAEMQDQLSKLVDKS